MNKALLSLLLLTVLTSACGVIDGHQSKEESVQKQAIQREEAKNKQREVRAEEKSAKEVKLAIAQEANDLALQTKGVVHVTSVAIDQELSLAVEVSQWQRWNLKGIRKEIFHALRDRFPDLEIHVSTDRKIVWELQKLEKEMYATDPDVAAIQKKLDKINEDMKG